MNQPARIVAIGDKPGRLKGCNSFNFYCDDLNVGHTYKALETVERGLILEDLGPFDKDMGRKDSQWTVQKPGLRPVLTLSRSRVSKLDGRLTAFEEELDYEIEGDRIYVDPPQRIIKHLHDLNTVPEEPESISEILSRVETPRVEEPKVDAVPRREFAKDQKPAMSAAYLNEVMWAMLGLDTLKRIGRVTLENGELVLAGEDEVIEESIQRVATFASNHPDLVRVDEASGEVFIDISV